MNNNTFKLENPIGLQKALKRSAEGMLKQKSELSDFIVGKELRVTVDSNEKHQTAIIKSLNVRVGIVNKGRHEVTSIEKFDTHDIKDEVICVDLFASYEFEKNLCYIDFWKKLFLMNLKEVKPFLMAWQTKYYPATIHM